jgi:ABC-type transport system substrate-binding protein
VDRIIRPVIPEYANRLSQIRAGNVDFLRHNFTTAGVNAEDALALKQARPDLLMQIQGPTSGFGPAGISFDLKPGSPFYDVRVRRAFSMLMDRDAYLDAVYNLPAFKAAGLPMEGRWNSNMGAGDPDYWTDPKSKDFGAGAEYFQFNPTEAKKLLQAANFPLNNEYTFLFAGTQDVKQIQILANFLLENGGVKTKIEAVPSTQAPQRVFQGGGLWDGGFAYNTGFSGGDLDQHLTLRYIPGSGPTVLYSKIDKIPPEFSKFIDLLKTARKQADPKKRVDILKNQVQQEMAVQMPVANAPGVADFLVFAQPWVGNWRAVIGAGNVDTQESFIHYWYDASKKTT